MIWKHVSAVRWAVPCRTTVGFAFVLAGFIGSPALGRGNDKQTPTNKPLISAKIADLAWIQGHWSTSFEENELHAMWSPPARDCIMASFCWIKNGKVWMYELLTIAEEDDGILFRFKHFSRELHGWEEKEEVLTLGLVELGENLAVFENVGNRTPRRLVYHRVSPTRLTVRVEGIKSGDGFELNYEKEN